MTEPTNVQYLTVHGKSAGGSAYVYDYDGRRWAEHCIAGRWHVCELPGTPRQNRLGIGAVLGDHLNRKTGHGSPTHGRLVGTHHAGGGLRPYVKGPQR